jgi:hypothetical protein
MHKLWQPELVALPDTSVCQDAPELQQTANLPYGSSGRCLRQMNDDDSFHPEMQARSCLAHPSIPGIVRDLTAAMEP